MGAPEAAARLKHDLAKAIRFSAPEDLEADTESLRARLRTDVLATRRGPTGSQSAAEVFEGWLAGEGRPLRHGALAAPVAEIASAVAEVRGLAERIDALQRAELERLDSLTRVVVERCRDLAREAQRGAKR